MNKIFMKDLMGRAAGHEGREGDGDDVQQRSLPQLELGMKTSHELHYQHFSKIK